MPRDEGEDEVGNVLKVTILVPVIQYFDIFLNTRHNLGPDEFLKTIYDPGKSETTRRSKGACDPNSYEVKLREISELQTPPVLLQKPIAQLFFEVIRLRPFLSNVVHEFEKCRNRRQTSTDVSRATVIIYVLIYRTSIALINDAMNCLIHFGVGKMLALLSFLLTPKLSSWFYISGCELFGTDFVEKKILDPFIKALPILQIMRTNLVEMKRRKPPAKKVTVAIQMNVLKHTKKFPNRPACTPEKEFQISVNPIPETLYKMPEIDSKIAALRREHRMQAEQRLKDANANAPACFKSKKSKRHQRIIEEMIEMGIKSRLPIVAQKIPTFKNVPVKKTITTILREGALIASSESKEVEKLKELMKGSFDSADIQRLEDEMRQREKEENLRKIEEKHLSGLISYEESILAKQQLIKSAKEQGDRVRLEREKLNAKLEEYRLKETEKLKRIVEKSHDAERFAKNAYAFMVDGKREKAAEVAEESRKIKLRLIEKREEELRRKLQLISEIKASQSLLGLRIKKFDPTETSKLGLMCEMSLAQLKKKLFLVKKECHDELISRKEAVKNQRQKRKDLVELTQKTIHEYRASKRSFPPSASIACERSKILQTPELEALRRKLEDRRIKRVQKKSSSTDVMFESKLSTKSS